MQPRELNFGNTIRELDLTLVRVHEQTAIVRRLEAGREQSQEVANLCERMGQTADRIASHLDIIRRTPR